MMLTDALEFDVYFDMDGCLTRFYDDIVDDEGTFRLDNMYMPGFFYKLKPYENVVSAVKLLAGIDRDKVHIVSAYDIANESVLDQKNAWLDYYLPEICCSQRLFTQIGKQKNTFIKDGVVNALLVDDYNKNLREWREAGGKSAKLVNDVNHTGEGRWRGDVGKLWPGPVIRYDQTPEEIVEIVTRLVNSK